jgi:hypothetical protein
MAGSRHKETVVTFKADDSLLEALRSVPNRSEFIRGAILAALESSCPLCGGSGVLTPNQRRHWDAMSSCHPLRECDDCHEVHLVCEHGRAHDHRPSHRRGLADRERRNPARRENRDERAAAPPRRRRGAGGAG